MAQANLALFIDIDEYHRVSLSGCEDRVQGKPASSNRAPRAPTLLDYRSYSALEATQERIDGCLSHLPYKCHLEEVVSVGE